MIPKPLPPHDILVELFDYNPITGELKWKPRGTHWFRSPHRENGLAQSRWNACHAGQLAFSLSAKGYLTGSVLGQATSAHRVAFKIHHRIEPEQIDHINGIRTDNRIINLRGVSAAENQRNTKLRRNNTTGRVGVSPKKDRFAASITINRKQFHLGSFTTIEAATTARAAAEKACLFHPNHGRVE